MDASDESFFVVLNAPSNVEPIICSMELFASMMKSSTSFCVLISCLRSSSDFSRFNVLVNTVRTSFASPYLIACASSDLIDSLNAEETVSRQNR